MNYNFPDELFQLYQSNKYDIDLALQSYKQVPRSKYFYELCYCLCTPQSSAANANKLQSKLEEIDFFNNSIDPTELLANPIHYIRFHNQKAKRLINVKSSFSDILDVLDSDISPIDKRIWLDDNIVGIGMKESSHFLRNIGYRNLAIIDRHLLKHLISCNVIDSIPKSITKEKYLKIEQEFLLFGNWLGISIDELDILFWSKETGFILK